MNTFGDIDDEFLMTSCQALRSSSGGEALKNLGWPDLLPLLDDAEARHAVFTFFRAQGRELASSGALSALMAQPFGVNEPGTAVATAIQRESARRGRRTVVIDPPDEGRILIDRPGLGAWLVDVGAISLRPIDIPGKLNLFELMADVSELPVSISEPDAAAARGRSTFLGQVALACDMLGSAETALSLAISHAKNREQFGQPIGHFQAVRHLLAAAAVDCAALSAVADQTSRLDFLRLPLQGQILKALAGRNSRRVRERSLQVLGAIGFTNEFEHHHFHGRVLALDSLLGSSTFLARRLASTYRTAKGETELSSLVPPQLDVMLKC